MSDYDGRSRSLARERYWDEHDKQSYNCPDCGRGSEEIIGTFHVHHKSENPHDNRLEKLIGLCGFCHRLREGKKPSLRRIRNYRDGSQPQPTEPPEPIAYFIDRYVCICTEGRSYPWGDSLSMWIDLLHEKLPKMGVEPTSRWQSEFIYWVQRIQTREEDTDVSIEFSADPKEPSYVYGPDPVGFEVDCDCVTTDNITHVKGGRSL